MQLGPGLEWFGFKLFPRWIGYPQILCWKVTLLQISILPREELKYPQYALLDTGAGEKQPPKGKHRFNLLLAQLDLVSSLCFFPFRWLCFSLSPVVFLRWVFSQMLVEQSRCQNKAKDVICQLFDIIVLYILNQN